MLQYNILSEARRIGAPCYRVDWMFSLAGMLSYNLLLGAEINSWHLGYTEPSGDIATILSQSDMWKHQRQPMDQEKSGA